MRRKYNEAIALAHKELKQLPRYRIWNWKRHWHVIHISSAYYEKKDYKNALKWAEKAYRMFPYCPLVLWHYGGALRVTGHVRAAIHRYHEIYERGLNGLAYGICAEGLEDARRTRSDVRYELAAGYYEIKDLNNAMKWGKLFLRYFDESGLRTRKQGQKLVTRCEKEIEHGRRK